MTKFERFIKTKRWNDPIESNDGWRLLICRYRPRALSKKKENWDTWWSFLGPSRELHADAYGKYKKPILWDEYKNRYLTEMQNVQAQLGIKFICEYVRRKNTITLLCSSACNDYRRCHRSLLKELIIDVLLTNYA